MESAQTQEKQKKKPGFMAALLLLILLLLALAVWLNLGGRDQPPEPEGLVYEENVTVGSLSGKTEEERVAELNELIDESMLSIVINSTPCTGVTEDGSAAVNWLIENPTNQGKLIRVEVYRDDTGESIYQTGAIKPGSYLESAPLDVELAPGTYDCTAMFYTYQLETEQYIGQGGAEITLTVS